MPSRILTPYSRIDPSPWPFTFSTLLVTVPISFVVWVWGGHMWMLVVSMTLSGAVAVLWVMDFLREGVYCGFHTDKVMETLTWGTLLFIVSEVMFFFSFFWAWAHSCWVPTVYCGESWPPAGVVPVHPYGLPLFNLISLVWSSCLLNYANGHLRLGHRFMTLCCLGVAIMLGAAFELAQLREYQRAAFGVSDGAFGSSFYLLTGFHGAHVFGGMGFLVYLWFRLFFFNYHRGFNISWVAGVWYWHFVDVIWLILWTLVYSWPLYVDYQWGAV